MPVIAAGISLPSWWACEEALPYRQKRSIS